MVSILKDKINNSKGLMVFTHKEKFLFENNSPIIKDLLISLKKSYIFGMHWGHFHDKQDPSPLIDFHLAGKGTVRFLHPDKVKCISFCSRNFLAPVFTSYKGEKFWDIIMIARPIKDKNIEIFFQVLKKLYQRNPSLKCLLISQMPFPDFPKQGSYYNNILKDYNSFFSDLEKENFLFLPVASSEHPFPISQKNIVFFLQHSKIFALFSDKEGESRVIAEALLCGLPIVARKDLIGGGLDYLNEENSRLFITEEEAENAFVDLLENKLEFDTDFYMQELCSDYTIEKFETAIKVIYKELGVPFEGVLVTEYLDRRLPNHFTPNFIEGLSLQTINDISSCRDFIRFANFLNNKKENDKNYYKFIFYNVMNNFIQTFLNYIGIGKSIFVKLIKMKNVRIYAKIF